MTQQYKHAPETHANTPIKISVFAGQFATKPHPLDTLTWSELGDEIEAFISQPAPEKAQMNAIGPYRLRSGTTRANANVERMGAVIALDVDRGLKDLNELLADIREYGIAAIVYTSPGDPNPDGSRRARVLLLSEEHAPEQCWAVRLAAARLLGVTPDKQTKDCSRILFAGALEGTPDRECYRIDGDPLTLDLLDLEEPTPAARTKPVAGPSTADPGDRVALVIEIIEPHYTDQNADGVGGRYDLTRALGSWLATRSMSGPWADAEIRAVIEALPSDQIPTRVKQALKAAAQARSGAVTIGWQCLAGRLGPEDSARLERAAMSAWELRCEATRAEGTARRDAKRKAAANTNSTPPGDEPYAPAADTADASDDHAGCDPAVDHVIEHLASPTVSVFQRAGLLVTVTREAHDDRGMVRPTGAPTIRELRAPRLREIIRTTAGPRDAALAGDVIARGEWAHIRPLDAIVSYPVMRRDGSLLVESGYDASTRTLAEMRVKVDVPGSPTLADARAALAMLTDLVSDFPFAGDAQRSAWLAALLTVPARPAIDGPTPMLLLDASARGSGKTLLADVIAVIVTGEPAPRRTAPETAEEWRKVIYAMLLAGDPICLIDNVTRMLASAALDAMLTGTTYQDRVLGVSEERKIPVRVQMIASANNCRVSTDLVRRSVHCRLEPDVEHPEQRTGFARGNLLEYVRRERPALLGAALTIVRAYAVAGRPRVDARPMGSYETWCRVVRDALVWVGAADPAATQDGLREDADVERDELGDLLTAWHELLGDHAVTARELLDAARSNDPSGTIHTPYWAADRKGGPLLDALRGIMPSGAEPAAHSVSKRLQVLRGQIVGGRVLRQGDKARGGVVRWRVTGAAV